MRFTVSTEQIKIFYQNSYLELEDILSEEEARSLHAAIKRDDSKSPGYPAENLYRSIPLISILLKKRGWAKMASELIKKKPLRIASDQFFSSPPIVKVAIDEGACGLFIDLEHKRGFFFKDALPKLELYNSDESCYLLVILTANRLPDQLNPIVFR